MASSETRLDDSEPVRLMATALDQVLERLPQVIERTDEMRREVALFIVDRFRSGERDPERLSDLALAELCPGGREGETEAGELSLVPDTDQFGEPIAG